MKLDLETFSQLPSKHPRRPRRHDEEVKVSPLNRRVSRELELGVELGTSSLYGPTTL